MTPKVFQYLEDGSSEQITKNSNESDFIKVLLKQRGMLNMKYFKGSSAQLLGKHLSGPVGVGSMPYQSRFHHDGEIAASVAARELNAVFTIDGGRTSHSIDDILKASEGGLKLLQINSYSSPEERSLILQKIKQSSDIKAVVLDFTRQDSDQRNKSDVYNPASLPKAEVLS